MELVPLRCLILTKSYSSESPNKFEPLIKLLHDSNLNSLAAQNLNRKESKPNNVALRRVCA